MNVVPGTSVGPFLVFICFLMGNKFLLVFNQNFAFIQDPHSSTLFLICAFGLTGAWQSLNSMFVRGQQMLLSLTMSPNTWFSPQSSKSPCLLTTFLKGILLPLCRRGGSPPNMQVFPVFRLNRITKGATKSLQTLIPRV